MLYTLQQAFESVRDFLELGGPVLVIISLLLLFMWLMILERMIYMRTKLNQQAQGLVARWEARPDHFSWESAQMKSAMIAEMSWNARQGLDVIKTCVALCPLLGLLGTVTGMIEVFDVMAVSGSGNARSMASGVSKATIPTMAGMVAALSGLFPSTWLEREAERRTVHLEDQLVEAN